VNKELPAGFALSHYRIVSKLGAGGMGQVYVAQDTKLDRKVAIKFLLEEFSEDADKLNRFIQEAKAASALNHPNILTVYEIGEVEGKNYISTELIDGATLRQHLSHKRTAYAKSDPEDRCAGKELEEKYPKREAIAMQIAGVSVGLGDKETALTWLEKAVQDRSGDLPRITWHPPFAPLRDDQRYKDVVRQMGLPE